MVSQMWSEVLNQVTIGFAKTQSWHLTLRKTGLLLSVPEFVQLQGGDVFVDTHSHSA